jgi:hypothetical protein
MPGVPEQQEKVATVAWPDPAPYRIDLLFVLDDSPAMQPHQAMLADAMRSAGYELHAPDVDLHVAVITADVGDEREAPNTPVPGQCAGWGDAAALRRSPLVDGSYIHYRWVRGVETTNVRGAVPDALAALADVGTGGCAHARPLEAMRIALDHDPHDGGFLRDDAKLAVVIVAGQDDESPRPLAEYEAFLKQLGRDVAVLVYAGDPVQQLCGEPPTDRLHAFPQLFPNRGSFSLICALAQGGVAQLALSYHLPGWGPLYGVPCFDEPIVDVDETTPGVQPDCVVSEHIAWGTDHQRERLLAACGTGSFPCWRMVEDSQCTLAQHLRVEVDRGGEDPPDNDVVEAQCVSS